MTTGRGFDPGMTGPMSVLRRITSRPPPDPDRKTCDMCAEPIGDDHPHVVGISTRQLMCVCRGCWLLFTAENADLRYKAVPNRYLSFPDFALTSAGWDGWRKWPTWWHSSFPTGPSTSTANASPSTPACGWRGGE